MNEKNFVDIRVKLLIIVKKNLSSIKLKIVLIILV